MAKISPMDQKDLVDQKHQNISLADRKSQNIPVDQKNQITLSGPKIIMKTPI